MINLIPNEEKKKMAHSFYYRFLLLLLIMSGVVFSFAILAMIPSYILSEAKEKFVLEKLEMQQAEPVPVLDQETSTAIEDLDKKLTTVESLQKDRFVVSEKVIDAILASKIAEVKITDISYENITTGKRIGISGVASSREDLLLFRKSLEANPMFKSIDLPITNFVKGSNIQFFLNLIPS